MAATPALAEKARELQFINGMDVPQAERSLFDRGFKHVSSHRNTRGYVYSYWWDERDDKCVYVEVYERSNRVESVSDAKDQDCGKSHHKEDSNYSSSESREFDRGYTDGLHHAPYHNYSRSDAYSDGYQKGADERQANLRNHHRRGGYH